MAEDTSISRRGQTPRNSEGNVNGSGWETGEIGDVCEQVRLTGSIGESFVFVCGIIVSDARGQIPLGG